MKSTLQIAKGQADHLRSLFLRGMQFALPIALLYVIVNTALGLANSWLGDNSATVAGWIFPSSWLVGPCGKLLGLFVLGLAVLLAGALNCTGQGRKVLGGIDWALSKLPLFGGIYRALRKMMNAFAGSKGESRSKRFQTAVLVDMTGHGQWQWGLVTGETMIDGLHHMIVMMPSPPNPTGGAIRYVPDGQWKQVAEIDSSSEAIEVLMSYGMVTPSVMTTTN
jgi:uncharacterized membrane protein